MLSKLIKHEFRATSRIMWPVFLGMLALTAIMRISLPLTSSSHWAVQMLAVLLVMGFGFGLVALAFAPLVLSACRWRDHVLKDEGYLTLTLPVNMHELLVSKLIVSAVWYAAYSIGYSFNKHKALWTTILVIVFYQAAQFVAVLMLMSFSNFTPDRVGGVNTALRTAQVGELLLLWGMLGELLFCAIGYAVTWYFTTKKLNLE